MKNQFHTELLKHNPIGVAKVFAKYGFEDYLLNDESLNALVRVFGEPAIRDLYNEMNNFEGSDEFFGKLFGKKKGAAQVSGDSASDSAQNTAIASGEEKKTNFFSKFRDAVKGFGQSGVGQALKEKLGIGSREASDQQSMNPPASGSGSKGDPKPEEEKIMGMSKGLFFGLCAVVLVVIVYAVVQSNKK